jgi:quaternary ammonium compound-resistance protein SugE
MAWLLLITAGLLEIVWAAALKESEGLSRLWPSVLGLTAAWVSFGLLALALRNLPVGTAYAVWVGIGATGVALVGMVALGEPATAARIAFLALIVVGVGGLRVVKG